MEVDPPTDSDQNTNSSTTNDKPEDMMEDGEDSSTKENSLLGKRGTDKDKEEIRSSEDEPSSKQAKMELRTRTKKNYSEENFATDDGKNNIFFSLFFVDFLLKFICSFK